MLSSRLPIDLIALVLCAVPAVAQLPKRLERCLPSPTLAQEIRDMQREVAPQKVTLHVVRIEFDPKSGIPVKLQREISAEVQRKTFEEDADTDYLKEAAAEIAEVSVRGSLQNRGYFRVLPDAKLTVLKADRSDVHVAAAVSAELGPQYWFGEIQFAAADPHQSLSHSQEDLRKLIPLNGGEVLNVDALREGLRKLTQLYGKEGYIDMTAEPEFNIAESTHVINVLLRIDQQKQYRMGQIEIWGLDELAKGQFLKLLPQPGEVLNWHKVEGSFEKNQSVLPADASLEDDVHVRRDTKAGIVSMLFDFRPCPGQAK